MIVLSLLKGPVECDLGDLYPGLKVTLRRLTSPELAEARDAALTVLRQARNGLEALSPYGLDGEDVNGQRLNPLDEAQMIRAGALVGAVEIAVRGLIGWEGVSLQGGEVAPINRETLSILLLDDALSRRLLKELEAASRVLVTEGNASGPSPAGSSGTQRSKAGAPPTAPAARRRAKPAPKAAEAVPAGTARKSKTPR